MEKETGNSPSRTTEGLKIAADSERRRSSGVDVDPSLSDGDSRRGSGTTAPGSSTSGIYTATPSGAASGIPQLKIDPGSQSEVESIAPERKSSPPVTKDKSPSPKKSPIRSRIKEGIRRIRKSLSPKRSEDEDPEGDKKTSPPSERSSESGKSPKRSPDKSPEKRSSTIFRSKSRSPGKSPDKRRSREESEPFLLGDELRRSSTSSDDDKSHAMTSPSGHQKSPKADKSPKRGGPGKDGEDKSPKKRSSTIFRSTSRSPGKSPDKRRSREESEPFLLGDELRRSSTSSDDGKSQAISPSGQQKSPKADKSPKRGGGPGKDGEDKSPKATIGKEKSRSGLKLKLKLNVKKGKAEIAPGSSKEDLLKDEGKNVLGPYEDIEMGKWSPMRMTPDDNFTCSPEETDMDLDSLSSFQDATIAGGEKSEAVIERDISSAGDQISKRLGLKDPEENSSAASDSPRRTLTKRQMESEAEETGKFPDPKKQPKIEDQVKGTGSKDDEKEPDSEPDT